MEIFKNKSGEKFTILGTIKKGSREYCNVKFLDSGYEAEYRKESVINGEIKDRYSKNIYGVACIGNVKKVGHVREYNVWYGMIKRCYDKSDKSFVRYGGNGVFVCDRWLVFEHFLQDISFIDGYVETLFHSGQLNLDKDKKQQGTKEKKYSLDTCCFLSLVENNEYRNMDSQFRKCKFTAISPEGKIYKAVGVEEFADKYNLNTSHIYNCLTGKRKQHKKWTFYREDKLK